MVREVLIGAHDVQIGFHLIYRFGGRNQGSAGVSNVVGSLVLGEIGLIGGPVFGPWMIPSGTSHFVADEAFIVSDVFSTLGGGEVDSVYIHCHGVSSNLFGS